MRTNLCICVLIGIPGSGKTTFARELVTVPLRKIVFSFDEFKVNEPNYKLYRKRARHRLEMLVRDEIDCSSGPTVIIVDDIMIYESMRYEIFLLSRMYKLGYCLIHLNTDVDLCVSRNCERESADVTEDMIRSQSVKIEEPRKNHSINRFSMEIRNNLFNPEEVLELFEKAFENPVMGIEEKDSVPNAQSDIHKIDLILRKHIGKCVSEEITSAGRAMLAKELNCRRQELLADIRAKALVFEDPFVDVLNYL